MSSSAAPIPSHRFAEAIKELPLANLHFKAAEIRNSISHLQSSNDQLQPFADDGDPDCREAIQENVVVIQRMEERIQLLKQEVEGRGFKWSEVAEDVKLVETDGSGIASNEEQSLPGSSGAGQRVRPGGGSIGDEELARRLAERIDDDNDENENGVHL